MRKAGDLGFECRAYLTDNLSVIQVVVQPRRDLFLIELRENVHVLAEQSLNDLGNLVHLYLRLGDILTVKDMGIRPVKQVLHEVILVEAQDGKAECMQRTFRVLGCGLEHLRIVLHGQQGILSGNPHEGIVIEPQSRTV